jgi:hypothetical protein
MGNVHFGILRAADDFVSRIVSAFSDENCEERKIVKIRKSRVKK